MVKIRARYHVVGQHAAAGHLGAVEGHFTLRGLRIRSTRPCNGNPDHGFGYHGLDVSNGTTTRALIAATSALAEISGRL